MIPKKDYIIPRARIQDLTPEVWNSISQTGEGTKKWHGIRLPELENIYIDRKCFCIYKLKDWDRITRFVTNRLIKHPLYFKKVWTLQRKFGKQAQQRTWRILREIDHLNQTQQLQALNNLKQYWLDFDQVNVLPWFLGAEGLRDYIQRQLVRLDVPERDVEVLWITNTLSLAAQEESQLYKAALNSKTKQDIEKFAAKLSKDFGWMPFGYDGPTFWDHNYYRKKIISLHNKQAKRLRVKMAELNNLVNHTTSKQNKIISNYKIPQSLVKLLDVQQKLYIMTDERKKVEFQIHYAYHELLKKLSKASGLTVLELKYLETDEILAMFNRKTFQKGKKTAQDRIKYPLYVSCTGGKIRLIESGKSVSKKLYDYVLDNDDISEFSGVTANVVTNRPIQGRVRLILNSREVGQMKKGEILVTAMTTPDFVPAMRIAKAIITDEGGITSHAAIVSRELGITSIIGTKVATQVLKTGNLVEVDATKGMVKILKH